MRVRFLGLIGLAAAAVSVPALALTPARILDAAEITAAFDGKTLAGIYREGIKWVESYHQGGTLDYREEAVVQMTGRWHTAGATFCTFYNERETGGCFMVTQVSENCYDFTFITRDVGEAESFVPAPRDWDARGWRTDSPGTCDEAVTS